MISFCYQVHNINAYNLITWSDFLCISMIYFISMIFCTFCLTVHKISSLGYDEC